MKKRNFLGLTKTQMKALKSQSRFSHKRADCFLKTAFAIMLASVAIAAVHSASISALILTITCFYSYRQLRKISLYTQKMNPKKYNVKDDGTSDSARFVRACLQNTCINSNQPPARKGETVAKHRYPQQLKRNKERFRQS